MILPAFIYNQNTLYLRISQEYITSPVIQYMRLFDIAPESGVDSAQIQTSRCATYVQIQK